VDVLAQAALHSRERNLDEAIVWRHRVVSHHTSMCAHAPAMLTGCLCGASVYACATQRIDRTVQARDSGSAEDRKELAHAYASALRYSEAVSL
jgi:hypothetical protein